MTFGSNIDFWLLSPILEFAVINHGRINFHFSEQAECSTDVATAFWQKCRVSRLVARYFNQRRVTGELSEVMAAGIKAADEHLKKAEKIMMSFEQGGATENNPAKTPAETTTGPADSPSKDDK